MLTTKIRFQILAADMNIIEEGRWQLAVGSWQLAIGNRKTENVNKLRVSNF